MCFFQIIFENNHYLIISYKRHLHQQILLIFCQMKNQNYMTQFIMHFLNTYRFNMLLKN